MDSIPWVLNTTGEGCSLFWNSFPFWQQAVLRSIYCRTFPGRVWWQFTSCKGAMCTLLTPAATSPAPAHTCRAAWPSPHPPALPDCQEGVLLCVCVWGDYCPFSQEHGTEQQFGLVLSPERGVNEEAWVSKKKKSAYVCDSVDMN